MEPWSARDDDRPYIRPSRTADFWLPALVVAVVVAAAGAFYYLQSRGELAFDLPSPTPPEAPAPLAAKPPPPPEPAIRHPLDTAAQPPAPSLPTLDNSDSMMRDSVAGLIGRKAFNDAVIPAQLVRRIVATVDNLPRPTAPRRMMPLQPVRGGFVATAGAAAIDKANFARYTPYVRVFDSLDAHALVRRYVRAYPLFQRAYEELGYPGKYFNDRLLEAIDDMLAAPEPDGPIALVQPKVLYQFADPDLEGRSAGQKILLRMGRDNALRVKAKLREIRRELIAAGTAPPARRAPSP
ncbi:MAG TPA: DUF3014 domain-containing protein [Burkholderiales bacterium]|nr:DUF3014 domain-containing protein [Burkholderiales bacterium]